jgi:hypothetical protein
MCDYSLASVSTRLAKPGEELVVHRFTAGALGLASRDDVTRLREESQAVGFWARFKRFCEACVDAYPRTRQVAAVCIPPGASLLVRDLSPHLQRECGCGEAEEVIFTQISAEAYAFRDAVVFSNGTQLLLQRLKEGQRVRVLSLSRSEEMETIPTQHEFSR